MQIAGIRERLRMLGANARHEERVLRLWARAMPQDAGKRPLDSFMPLAVRNALPALADELAGLAQLQSRHPGDDGSERLLVALRD
ncbi:MAG TPA: rRNA methyltransferase, partial [Rubrivivax sp.]|nr:rRNA methyltransferase [Rubrivivax sp.]